VLNLDDLLARCVEGTLTDADQQHLAACLRDDPAAQARYRAYLLLDADLRWAPPSAPALVPPRRWGWAVAASVLCLVGAGWWLTGNSARADVVERLAEWTLTIADAPTPTDRHTRYAAQAEQLAREVQRLPASERPLAEQLLATAQNLAEAREPLERAERLDQGADDLLAWMLAQTPTDPRRAQQIERQYLRFVERSLSHLHQATEPMDEVNQRRIERMTERIAKRAEARVRRELHRQPAE
jgi:predicted membrane metal-binding protein